MGKDLSYVMGFNDAVRAIRPMMTRELQEALIHAHPILSDPRPLTPQEERHFKEVARRLGLSQEKVTDLELKDD